MTAAAERKARTEDCDKLREALEAIQSLVLHADCLADEVSTPEARAAMAELQEYAAGIAHDCGSTIKAALFDLGQVERVHLVPVTGSVNDTERS